MLELFMSTQRVGGGWMRDHDNELWFWYDHENGQLLQEPPKPKPVRNPADWPSWRRVV